MSMKKVTSERWRIAHSERLKRFIRWLPGSDFLAGVQRLHSGGDFRIVSDVQAAQPSVRRENLTLPSRLLPDSMRQCPSRFASTAPCLCIDVAFRPDGRIGRRRTISQADDFFCGEADSEGGSDSLQDELRILAPPEPQVGPDARNQDHQHEKDHERTMADRPFGEVEAVHQAAPRRRTFCPCWRWRESAHRRRVLGLMAYLRW